MCGADDGGLDGANDAAEAAGAIDPGPAWSRRSVIGGAIAGFAATAGAVAFADSAFDQLRGASGALAESRPERLAIPERRRWGSAVIGTSAEGRPILVHGNAVPGSRATVLVISAVHGDERGVGPVGVELTTVPIPTGIDAYVVPVANPDGWARGTRLNARNVDLNRNFPWWWRHGIGGPTKASEPETQAMMAIVQLLKPTVTVWIHQPYEYVSAVDPSVERLARAWGDAAGLRLEPPIRQQGGGESWTYHGLGMPSILVEGTTRDASVGETSAHRRGFEALLAAI